MRKLADYAFMLRDYRLAQSVYDMLRTDYANDKAWKHQAGAMEFTAITALLTGTPPAKSRQLENAPDSLLENAAIFYHTKCLDPFAALRTLAVGAELLQLRAGTTPTIFGAAPSAIGVHASADDAAKCFSRGIEMQLLGAAGYALTCERAAACFASRTGSGTHSWGARKRKAAFWNVLAAERWLQLDREQQATDCMSEAVRLYGVDNIAAMSDDIELKGAAGPGVNLAFEGVRSYVMHLRETLQQRTGADIVIIAEAEAPSEMERQAALERIQSHDIEAKSSRKSHSVEITSETNSIASKSSTSMSRERSVSFARQEPKLETSGFSASNDMLGPPPTPVAVADKPDIRKHRRSMSKVALGMVPEAEGDPLGAGVQVTRPRAASRATGANRNASGSMER